MIEAALDTFEAVANRPTVSVEEISAIVIAASSQFKAAWMTGTDLLMRLTRTHSAAQQALLTLARSKRANERFQIVATLNANVPRPVAAEVVRNALDDHGNRIRKKAAEACDRLELNELQHELERCITSEVDADVKQAFEFHLSMLRDGYVVRYRNGKPMLTIRDRDGWRSRFIRQDDIDRGKLPTIVAEARRGT